MPTRRRLDSIEAAANRHAGEIPLILKINNHDLLHDEKDPLPAVTAGVKDALRLGCVAIGFTIYPGSAHAQTMYQQLREAAAEAKANGLAVVVWSYPRGSSLSKEGETAIDVCSLRGADCGATGRPRHQSEAAQRAPRTAGSQEGLREGGHSRSERSPSASATLSRAPLMDAAS